MTTTDHGMYLTTADQMLRGDGNLGGVAVADGWWPKACACLIRLALEAAINAYWQQTSPAIAQYGNGRIKLLMLRRRIPLDLARQATYAWAALSRATHHHCYEAPPSVAELRRLHQLTMSIATAISGG
jgi:hypothetical protein